MNYEEIFRRRGGAYDEAMGRWPDARREEFLVPIGLADPRPGEVVLDVPAGGGYLRRYLPAGCHWRGHEPCASFGGPGAADTGLLPLPWADGSAAVALSVAGVHHLEDKRPLFRELHRVLSPGGRFVLADVHADSRVARFLDEFVGAHNTTGHRGDYLDERTVTDLGASGFAVHHARRTSYGWWFGNRREAAAFCRLLFDIRGAGDEAVAEALGDCLGFSPGAGGTVGINWELMVIAARRRP